jgi:hypothetical protein
MPMYVVRVWIPDRPGALGAVASRIGAVGGDLVGIDILERGGGRAIDELVVDLPDDKRVPLLISEMGEVDGVDVEELRPVVESLRDARLDALETAAVLVEQLSVDSLLVALANHAAHDFDAEWATVIDLDAPSALASTGATPPVAWLGAFVAGSRLSAKVHAGECGPDEVAWASLSAADLELVIGRRGRPFRARERRQLAALARIADSRWMELVTRSAKIAHPSTMV